MYIYIYIYMRVKLEFSVVSMACICLVVETLACPSGPSHVGATSAALEIVWILGNISTEDTGARN